MSEQKIMIAMTQLPKNPLGKLSINNFHQKFIKGKLNAEDITRLYLKRIEAIDPKLQAFEYVNSDGALRNAKAMDQLRDSGVNLGPLMGLPIVIKDVANISGLPAPHAGSKTEIEKIFDTKTEGPFIKALRAAGCIILGQTKTVEFCLGITGVSEPRGTPWNPWDLENQRIPGGSSSGSAVAVAAGLCALAIGTDTGGSVRVPAAYNGIFSLKTSFGLWPNEGIFPLDPKLDTLGLLTRTATDAQTAFHTINRYLFGYKYRSFVPKIIPDRLRFGKPNHYFFDALAKPVENHLEKAINTLKKYKIKIDSCSIPAAQKREEYFPISLPTELLAKLGTDFFHKNKDKIDPIIATRIASAIENKATDFLALEAQRKIDIKKAQMAFNGFDAWITPTTADVAPLLADFNNPKKAMAHALGMSRNTQPGNYLEFCAVSIPVNTDTLPVGLQLMAPAGHETRLLAISVACEKILGTQKLPDI